MVEGDDKGAPLILERCDRHGEEQGCRISRCLVDEILEQGIAQDGVPVGLILSLPSPKGRSW